MGNLGREQHGSGIQGNGRADQHAAAGEGVRLAGVLGHARREHSRRHAQGQRARRSRATSNRRCSAAASSAATSACKDPLGRFPEFFADVRARDLDLGLVTQTFEVGSITGKLEVDVLGLELFGWSPTAFDARLATPKGDKSRHRISAKAVSSLSNVGGGGGGVVQALQSGVLRFFDEYSYDKLGITCRLVGDVCEMSGIEPAGVGLLHRQGRGPAAHRHRRQPGTRQLESADVVDLHRRVQRRTL